MNSLYYKYLLKTLHIAWLIKIQANVFILFIQWINKALEKSLNISSKRETDKKDEQNLAVQTPTLYQIQLILV